MRYIMSKELMQQRIKQAQEEIDSRREQVKAGKMRQHYHFMPEKGWMNDPNGFIFFDGKYHFFYQTNPYEPFWNSMHWGHAVSSDLVNWEYLPLALAPSEAYDDHPKGGCFSGSAIEHEGKLYLMFTASANFGRGMEQTQCIASSEDGIHFEKYEGNPVITAPDFAEPGEFRDPKIWKHGEYFYCVLAARLNGNGAALLYRSSDILHWEYVNVLAESRGEWGDMWECPDLFPVGDKYILTFSPVRSGDHTSVFLKGDFDYKTGRFRTESASEIDWGFDYYAPHSFQAPDGRRITTAWANGWEWMPGWKDWGPAYKEGWTSFFSLSREVNLLADGRVQFTPIRELKELRIDAHKEAEISVTGERLPLTAGDGISCELRFDIDLDRTDAQSVELCLRSGEGKKTVCLIDLAKGELSVNRNHSDGWSRGVSRSLLFLKDRKLLDVHIFLDQSSIEIYTDNYTNNHSNNVYAGDEQNAITVRAEGGKAVLCNYESYGLRGTFR